MVAAIARALGASRREEASALVMHALLIALVAGGAFAVVLAGFPHAVLGLVAGPVAAQAAADYRARLFGAGAVLAWLAERAGLGLAGLGIAFALVFWAAATAMAVVVLRSHAGFAPTLRLRPSGALFRRILSVGLVASLLAAIANLATILVTAQVAAHGAAAVAAYGIAARLEFLMIPLAFSVGSALTALVGHAVGAGDRPTARRTAWAGGLLALFVAGSAGLAVSLAPTWFASVFTDDPRVVAIAARALSFTGPTFGGFGLGMALYFGSMGAAGMGLDGLFIGVALGITAYGVVTATSVRPGVWPGGRP